MSNITEFHQLINSLPTSMTMNVTILNQWCIAHNWSDLQIDSRFKFYAVPPGGSKHIPLPQSAIVELEQKEDLFNTVQEARERRHFFKESRQHLITGLLLSLPCFGVSILTNTNAVTNVPTALIIPREIRKEFNLLTTGLMGIWLVFALVTSLKYWKYHKLKNKIAILSSELFEPNSTEENEN